MAQPIAPKICTKNELYVPRLRCKFQVSIFSRFEIIAFSIFVYEFVKYAKKTSGLPTQSVAEVPIKFKPSGKIENENFQADANSFKTKKHQSCFLLIRYKVESINC